MSKANSPQAEIQIPRPKKNLPPKQLKKLQKRMEKFNAKKGAESAASRQETEERETLIEDNNVGHREQISAMSEVGIIKKINKISIEVGNLARLRKILLLLV